MLMQMVAEDILFSYNRNPIFEKVNLEIEEGQLLSIVGPNGIGKSTLVKCLTNIYKPDNGVVYLDGKDILTMDARKLAKNLGYVPQIQSNSFSVNVYEVVLLGRRPYIKWKVSCKDEEIIESILERLSLTHLAERPINTLSGGERQKVAIARALAQEPSTLFLDEPTSNLDINHQLEVMKILYELAHNDHKAVVIVIHDLNLAAKFSDYVFLMGHGGIYAAGKPEEVFTTANIQEIYDIEVEIIQTTHGSYIIPISS